MGDNYLYACIPGKGSYLSHSRTASAAHRHDREAYQQELCGRVWALNMKYMEAAAGRDAE